jgi:hypothetical protein
MKTLSLILISLFFFGIVVCENCNELENNSTCDFYPKCLENKFNCGASGYPLGYGNKYCNRFLTYFDKFSPAGQGWIQKTLVCLKHKIAPSLKDPYNAFTCSVVEKVAFDSHPQCYVESGFCDLFRNKDDLKSTLKGLFYVFEVKDLASAMSFKQIFITAGKCGWTYAAEITAAIAEVFSRGFLE